MINQMPNSTSGRMQRFACPPNVVANDADAIGNYMADDWTIIGADGSVCDKATFLELVRSGVVTHDVMESHDVKVRVYGETKLADGDKLVVARPVAGG